MILKYFCSAVRESFFSYIFDKKYWVSIIDLILHRLLVERKIGAQT